MRPTQPPGAAQGNQATSVRDRDIWGSRASDGQVGCAAGCGASRPPPRSLPATAPNNPATSPTPAAPAISEEAFRLQEGVDCASHPDVCAAAAAAAATLAVKPMASRRNVPRRKAGEAVCALSSTAEKLAALKTLAAELGGLDELMLAWDVELMTPSGLLGAVGSSSDLQGRAAATAFLRGQRDARPAELRWHGHVARRCLHLATHGCSNFRSAAGAVDLSSVNQWCVDIASIVRSADQGCPQAWSGTSIHALVKKCLVPWAGPIPARFVLGERLFSRVLRVLRNSRGWHVCRARGTEALHRTLWLCFSFPGQSWLKRCTEHEHGLVCIGGSASMLALWTVALISDYPRLAPAFSRRSCFKSWWWRRWVERGTPPPDVIDWVADSSFLHDGHNTISAAKLCEALRDFCPSLRKWGDALVVPAVPWAVVTGDSR